MNNQLSEFRDLTLDFLGSQEYLVLIPKNWSCVESSTSSLSPGSAIIAKKVTNSQSDNAPNTKENLYGSPKENLDSQAYNIKYSLDTSCAHKNPTTYFQKIQYILNDKTAPSPKFPNLLVSKADLTSLFHIAGVLQLHKLEEITKSATESTTESATKSKSIPIDYYIDIFPEYKDELHNWVSAP